MTESQVVNEWIKQGEEKGTLLERRNKLLFILEERFPSAASAEVIQLINDQDSLGLLDDWFKAALKATTFEEFLRVVKF